MTKLLRSTVECAVEKTEKPKIFRFVGSSEKPNRHGDIIDQDGWETGNWEKNPVILWDHNHSLPPIGRGIALQKKAKPKQLVFDVEFAETPLANEIRALVEQGFIKGVSVGFVPQEVEPVDPKDDSWFAPRRYKKQELLELSIVNIPANPHTLILNRMNVAQHLGADLSKLPGIYGLEFQKDKFATKESVETWLKAHGTEVSGIKENSKSFLAEMHTDGRPVPFIHKVEDGVGAVLSESFPQEDSVSQNYAIGIIDIPKSLEKLAETIQSLSQSQTEQNKVIADLTAQVSKFSYLTELTKEPTKPESGAKLPEDTAAQKVVGSILESVATFRKQLSGVKS